MGRWVSSAADLGMVAGALGRPEVRASVACTERSGGQSMSRMNRGSATEPSSGAPASWFFGLAELRRDLQDFPDRQLGYLEGDSRPVLAAGNRPVARLRDHVRSG